jgi:membrane protease YdiL (CAAX protease family)
LDFLGLRRAAWRIGNAGSDSFRASSRIQMGQTSNNPLEDRRVDRRNCIVPATVLGAYFRPSGWLYFVDLVFGMALVAGSEEIVFRRCARDAFQPYLGNGFASVAATSLLFGCYHWWAGLGTIVVSTMIGILLMLFLQRSDALWPVALAHYLIDVIDFS